MPLYMDLHRNVTGSPEDAAEGHLRDLETQRRYGVRYLRYWFNLNAGTVFCLVEAPSSDAAVAVHREAHGQIADDIIEVEAGMVQDMMGTAEEAPAWTPGSRGKAPAESPFRTILFTDMEGSTATTQSIGDARTMELLHTHDAIIRRALAAWGGREVKHMGDGIMGCFDSVTSGVECARAIQKGFASHNLANAEMPIRVRVGLSAGEPVEQHRDLFGAAVQMAARICRLAGPERILVSNVIRELAIGKQFVFEDRGDHALKGFQEPVRVWEVHWAEGVS